MKFPVVKIRTQFFLHGVSKLFQFVPSDAVGEVGRGILHHVLVDVADIFFRNAIAGQIIGQFFFRIIILIDVQVAERGQGQRQDVIVPVQLL